MYIYAYNFNGHTIKKTNDRVSISLIRSNNPSFTTFKREK